MNDFTVALANSIEVPEIEQYVFDDNYVFEQKLDGVRLAVRVNDGKVSGINRSGVATPVDRAVIRGFVGATGEWLFDGEWINDTFWIFDLVMAPFFDIRPDAPFAHRRHALEEALPNVLADCSKIRLVPTHRTPTEKVAVLRWVAEHNAEGLMVKDVRAPYHGGKRTNAMLKMKLIETVDCIVSEVGREGKRSVAVEVLDGNGEPVDVGSVKVTEAMLRSLKKGDVIEVQYLYFTESDRLYQAQFRRVRPDKNAAECTVDQLKYTDKSVLATTLVP